MRAGVLPDRGAYERSEGATVGICTTVANSTGRSGELEVTGNVASTALPLALTAVELPPAATCMFLCSRTPLLTTNPGGSLGNLRLSAPIGRFARPGEVGSSAAAGVFGISVDLGTLPSPTGTVSAAAGETWFFQAWHRDSVGGAAVSNFTGARSVTLL